MSTNKKTILTENDLIPGKCYKLIGCYYLGNTPPLKGVFLSSFQGNYYFLHVGEAFLVVSNVMILSPRGLCKMPFWRTGDEVIEIPTKKEFL